MTIDPASRHGPGSGGRFDGSVAAVTGGASGIGKAIAVGLAAEGARVAIFDVDGARAVETAEQVAGSPNVSVGLAVDVRVRPAVAAAVEEVISRYGQLDLLVNCAGVVGRGPIAELPEATWRRVLGVNLDGVFFTCQAAFPHLAGSPRGAVVNIASTAGVVSHPGGGAYGPSKAAVVALTKQLAAEWGPARIRVNAVSPGTTDTPLTRDAFVGAVRQAREERIPLGRLAAPDDIAAVVLFLLSADARYVTGQDVRVDGGFTQTLFTGPDAWR